MIHRYYSSRNKQRNLTIEELYQKLKHLYLYLKSKDFFKEKAGISQTYFPDSINYKAALELGFQPFPVENWLSEDITEDHIFDMLEFLYDHVSAPGEMVSMTDETGWNYYDYKTYSDQLGREEFRARTNAFLIEYKTGFELTKGGIILSRGQDGLQYILDAEIIPYDEENVDSKVRNAIIKWRNRHMDLSEKKVAIRELADVFEWLKKTKNLGGILDKKDDAALFDIANNFAIRHHNPSQKTDYDLTIWYSWIFHFYLATYHASIRLLLKKGEPNNPS